MKELTLNDIQQVSLDLLLQFDAFCRSNGISYTLSSGTLIGAVRHKGFIPWDDDIDVFMVRPEFEKLCSTFKSTKETKLFAPSLNNSYIPYGRFCDMTRTKVTSPAPWTTEETGVWIDIFPVDGASDEYQKHCETTKIANQLYEGHLRERFIRGRLKGNLINKLSFLKNYMMGRGHCKNYVRKYENFCKEIPYGSTSHVCILSCMISKRTLYFDIKDFQEYITMPFEGHCFMVASGYHNILTTNFGDYMQLPKEENRVPCHAAHKYYWK